MNLRLLMLNNEFPPLGGGTGTVNEYLIQQLAKQEGIAIDLVTSSLSKHTYEVEEWLPGVRIFKVPVDKKNIHHASNLELLTYARRALLLSSRLVRQAPYDVCLAFSTVPAGGVALGLWRMHGLPFLVRVGGPDIPGFEERYALVTRLMGPLIRQIWRSAQVVIAKCQHEQMMVKNAFPGARIAIIPNAVDSDKFRPATEKVLQGDRSIRLLCVARLIPRKGQDQLLEATRLLKDRGCDRFKVVLVGEGDTEAHLKARAEKLGILDKVDFRGYVPREEMPQVYAGADVFVLPTANEGMSVATLEAMASGLPLVVTRASGLDELVDGNGYTFAKGDVTGLAGILEKLIQSAQLRQEMGARSRRLSEQFGWEEVGQAYTALLSSTRGEP